MSDCVIYLVRSWPRLSQTFIVDEVVALERRGRRLAVFSMSRSDEEIVQPQVAAVRAPVAYLEDVRPGRRRRRFLAHLTVLAASPLRYARTMAFCLRHPGLARGYTTSSTLGCFDHAVDVCAAVGRMRAAGDHPTHVHAHFAHDPALVALLVGRLTGLPFSFTAHARDLLQIPASALATRAAEATALVTCCQANADYIASVVPASRRPPVRVVHHGVELDLFAPRPRDPAVPVPTLVSVGRLVEKKGYADLLRALAVLKASGELFSCRVYGDGPLREQLVSLREELDLDEQVELLGARDRDEILDALAGADVFVLTPRVTADGDRDGIPNVLVEAMACGLPVVTTSAGGIAELVQHGVNGLLTAPGDAAAVADSVGRVLRDGALRRDLGAAARRTVECDYDVDAAARVLDMAFRPRSAAALEATR